MKKVVFVCLSITCLLFSCIDNSNVKKSEACAENDNLMRYTGYIDVRNYKSGYYVNISNPWNNNSLGEFYLYPDSLVLPDEISDKTVIRIPCRNVTIISTIF